MVNITLHGLLGKKLGKYWNLEVNSVLEIFDAIEANNHRINKYFNDFNKFFTHFIVFIDGQMMPAHLIKSNVLKEDSKVEILPVIQGGWALIIIGIVLIAVSIILSIVLSPKAPKDVKTNSTILGGIRNVLNRNIPVPIGYGRMRLGSSVISNDIAVVTINNSNPAANNYDAAYGSIDL